MIANKHLVCLTLVLYFCVACMGANLGGLEDEKLADEEVRKVLTNVEVELRKRYPKEIESIEPISYRTQLVAGRNFFIRALIYEKDGNKSHAHLRVYRKFSGQHELTSIKTGVSEGSKLEYFQ